MNISFNYRPSHLISSGILCLVLFNLVFFSFIIALYNTLLVSEIAKYRIFLILILIIEPLFIVYGVYNIIKGRYQFDIEFNEKNFEFSKNLKSETVLPIEKIKRVIITYGNVISIHGGFKYTKIEIEPQEGANIELFIRGKTWRSNFKIFLNLLKRFCDDNQIQIDVYEKIY